MAENLLTTISVTPETKDKLQTYGRMGDSFEELLLRIMKFLDKDKIRTEYTKEE